MKLNVYSFSAKTTQPLMVADKTISERSGVVLLLSEGSSVFGIGEASPLPFWSKESFDTVISELDQTLTSQQTVKAITSKGFFKDLRWGKIQSKLSPSTSWALYNAFKIKTEPWTHTRVNALARLDDSDIIKKIIELEKQGYTSVKIKVQPKHVDYQADTLREILANTHRVKVRLDANQSLTQKEASTLLKNQIESRIDYFEEPLALGSTYFEDLKSLQNEFNIAFAFDETLTQFTNFDQQLANFLKAIKKNKIASHFILKPMLLGARIFNLAPSLADLGSKCIISSAYESPAGLFCNSRFSNDKLNIDMGLDLPPLDIDWSRFTQKSGPSIRIQKEAVVDFCKDLPKVRTYELN